MKKQSFKIMFLVLMLTIPLVSHARFYDTQVLLNKEQKLQGMLVELKTTNDAEDAYIIGLAIHHLWNQIDDPDLETAFAEGRMHQRHGDYPKALDKFDFCIENHAGFGRAYVQRALIHFLMGNEKNAKIDINIALKLNPLDWDAWFGKSMIYFTLKDFKTAKTSLEKALAIYPLLPGVKSYQKSIEVMLEEQKKSFS